MNVEIEAKIKVENLEEFIVKLEQLGGEFQKKVLQKDTYFDEPEGRLLRDDCGLRLRVESEGADSPGLLCFKGARKEGRFKRRQEIEFAVGDIAKAQELLEALGFVCTMVVEKHRQVYRLHDCEVCLDRVSGLGDFIEIEGPGEAAISRVQARLGLADGEHIRDSYATLLAGKRT